MSDEIFCLSNLHDPPTEGLVFLIFLVVGVFVTAIIWVGIEVLIAWLRSRRRDLCVRRKGDEP